MLFENNRGLSISFSLSGQCRFLLFRVIFLYLIWAHCLACTFRDPLRVEPVRALAAPSISIAGHEGPLPSHVVWAGTVTQHTSSLVGVPETTLTVDTAGENGAQTLTYRLPGGSLLPIEKGEHITLSIYADAQASPESVAMGLIVYDERGTPIIFLDENGALPPEAYLSHMTLRPGNHTTYHESKAIDGVCDVILEHRAVQFQGNLDASPLTLAPGVSGHIHSSTGWYRITLLDYARVVSTTCEGRDLARLAFLSIKIEGTPPQEEAISDED